MFRNIEAERMRLGLKRDELAKMLKVSPPTLRSWINKESPIPSTKLQEMSKVFDCAIDYLLEDKVG